MDCPEISDAGERCVERDEHWLHTTEPDAEGMVTAWGGHPADWVVTTCIACGLSATGPVDDPVIIVHNSDGSHSVHDSEGNAVAIDITVEQPRHLHAVPTEEVAMHEDQPTDFPLDPHYHVTTIVNGQVIGEPEKPIPDPFAQTRVEISWLDVLRAALKRRRPSVVVNVGGDWDAIKHVMTVRPIQVTAPTVVGDRRMRSASGFEE